MHMWRVRGHHVGFISLLPPCEVFLRDRTQAVRLGASPTPAGAAYWNRDTFSEVTGAYL